MVVRESSETSILVIGSSRPANGEFLRLFPENAVFLMNAIDWMTFGSELIGIRSRTSGERPLTIAEARSPESAYPVVRPASARRLVSSRTSGVRTLPDLPARAKTALKVGNVILFPAAIAFFGFLTLLLRRRRRNAR